MHDRPADRGGRGAGQVLVAECDAFLQGRYRQWLERRGQRVPAWAWLNGLAHGSRDDLVAMAAGAGPSGLVAELAAAVLRRADQDGGSLAAVQASKLLPLETKLRQSVGWASPTDDGELTRWLASALRGHSSPRG